MMNLSGGNLVVHSGFNLGSTVNTTLTQQQVSTDITPTLASLKLKAWPNPTERFFTLYVEGNTNEIVHVKVSDLSGRVVYVSDGPVNQSYRFGDNFINGIYVAEVMQGDKRKTIKLIKQQ